MKTKILLNSPSSASENFILMFRHFITEIELHVITQTCLVERYARQEAVFKIHDISADYVNNLDNLDVVNFVVPVEIPLWEYVEYDRFLFRRPYEEVVSVARHHCLYLQNLLIEEKFDFILGEIAGFEHALLYWYGKSLHIPFIWPMMSFWPGKFFVTNGGPFGLQNQIAEICQNFNLLEDEFKDLCLKAEAYIQTVTSKMQPMAHVQDHIKGKATIGGQIINQVSRLPGKIPGLVYHLTNPPKMYLDATPLQSLVTGCIRKISYKLLDRAVFIDSLPSGEKNVVYFLHYEPDLSTLVWSPYFKNQLEVITNIAFSLPNNYRLYVKEHPLSAGTRPIGYYNKIKAIPNLRLLSHNYSNKELIENTSIVITVTGTVGWEGLLFGKPVITLGNVFINAFKGVVHLDSWAQLKCVIADLLRTGATYSKKEVIEFVSLVMAATTPGDYYNTISNPADVDNLKLVAGAIIEYAKHQKNAHELC